MPAINLKVIGELRALQNAGSPGILPELIGQFLQAADAQLSQLRRSVAARDAKTSWRVAHELKAGCGNLGAQAMSRMCVELQTAGHAADWARADGLLSGLEAEFGSVRSELETEKRRG